MLSGWVRDSRRCSGRTEQVRAGRTRQFGGAVVSIVPLCSAGDSAETMPTQRDPHLPFRVDRRGNSYTQLCDDLTGRSIGSKTKFGPDVGKFLRVHVAPVQGEKAE